MPSAPFTIEGTVSRLFLNTTDGKLHLTGISVEVDETKKINKAWLDVGGETYVVIHLDMVPNGDCSMAGNMKRVGEQMTPSWKTIKVLS